MPAHSCTVPGVRDAASSRSGNAILGPGKMLVVLVPSMLSGCCPVDHGHWMGCRTTWNRVSGASHIDGVILFANHKANGVVTNIGLLANTVDDTGSYMAG